VQPRLGGYCAAGAVLWETGNEAVVVLAVESMASDGLDDAGVDAARAAVFLVEVSKLEGRGF